MKVVVLKEFTDRHTNEDYFPGEVLEITNDRYEEIVGESKWLVEKMEEEDEKEWNLN